MEKFRKNEKCYAKKSKKKVELNEEQVFLLNE